MQAIESLLSDISIIDEFHKMEPFWDLLAEQWMQISPNHHLKDAFYFFCDLDSKGTYALYQNQDEEESFMNPEGGCMKAGYLLKGGDCWMIGNENHQFAWWIADDWIWNMLLWDIDSSGREKCVIPAGCIGFMDEEGIWQIAPSADRERLNLSCWQSSPYDMDHDHMEKLLLNAGLRKSSPEIDHLESCLEE